MIKLLLLLLFITLN